MDQRVHLGRQLAGQIAKRTQPFLQPFAAPGGIPLPLVSYGGSGLLANLMAVGILVACARDEPDARAWLRRQRKSKQPRRRLSAVLPGRRGS